MTLCRRGREDKENVNEERGEKRRGFRTELWGLTILQEHVGLREEDLLGT